MTPRALLRLFAIRPSERWVMLVAALLLAPVQILYLSKYHALFAHYSEQNWRIFSRNFHTSGFDPISYSVLTDWSMEWDPLRHPLLALFCWPLAQMNEWLLHATGYNGCLLAVAAVLFVCSCYGWLMLHRTLHDVSGLSSPKSLLLCLYFHGMAYVLLSTYVPDHFGLSLFLLLTALHITALKLKRHELFSASEAVLLFVVTAGVTLTNGVPIFLMVAAVNGRDIVRPRMLGAFAAASMALMVTALISFHTGDRLTAATTTPVEQQMRWVQNNVSRGEVLVENFFGESLQLHRKHILGDVLNKRPIIVRYTWKAQYAVEAIIVLLFLLGAWKGRRARLVWVVTAILGFNLCLHILLGFALHEVHIMTAHWAFCLPVATAYALRHSKRSHSYTICSILLLVTLYLWTYHGYLLHRYLTWPMSYK